MYALTVAVSIEAEHMDEANRALQDQIVPLVRQSPGLVAGYWLAPMGTHGYSFIVYDTKEHAEGAAEMARSGPNPGFVKFDRIEVQEIIAQT